MAFETVNRFGDIEQAYEGARRLHVDQNGDDTNDGALESQPKATIQAAYDAVTNQGAAILVHAGSYAEALTFGGATPNVGVFGETSANTAPITFITQPVTISGAANTSVRMTHLGLTGALTIDGTQGRHYLTGCALGGGLALTGTMTNLATIEDCAINGLTVPATFGGVLNFIRCDFENIAPTLSNASPLQVIISDCTNVPAGFVDGVNCTMFGDVLYAGVPHSFATVQKVSYILQNDGATALGIAALGNFATGGAIGSAATTVDIKTAFAIAQTTAGQVVTLPNPTDTARSAVALVINTGTAAFKVGDQSVKTDSAVLFVWDGAAWVPAGGSTCPGPMTRAALLALRTAGALSTECRYTITDPPVTGNFAPSALVFDAVSATELAMEGEAIVSFDVDPVTVFYNIETNTYSRVIDKARNDVRGNHAQIGQFPWGVSNVYANTIVETTLTFTASTSCHGNTLTGATVTVNGTFYQNTITGSVVTQGGGSFYRNTVLRGSTVINGTLPMYQNEFSAVTLNTTGSTGSGLRYCTFTDTFSLTNVQNVTTLDLAYVTITGNGRLTVSGANRCYMRHVTLADSGYITQAAATLLDCTGATINLAGYVRVDAGRLYVTNSTVSASSYIRNNTTGTNRVTGALVANSGRVRFLGTTNGCQFNNSVAQGSGAVDFLNASLNSYVANCAIQSSSSLTIDGAVNARVYYCTAQSTGRISILNQTAQLLVYYCTVQSAGQINVLNGAGGRLYSVDVSAQSILRLTASVAASILYYSSFTAYYYLYLTGVTLSTTRSGWHGYGRRTYTPATMPPNGTFTQNF